MSLEYCQRTLKNTCDLARSRPIEASAAWKIVLDRRMLKLLKKANDINGRLSKIGIFWKVIYLSNVWPAAFFGYHQLDYDLFKDYNWVMLCLGGKL